MNLLLAADPTKFFGTNHIILLCISVALIIGLSILIAKSNIKFSTILNIMLIIWVFSEAIKLCSNMHYLILGADDSYRIIKIIEYVGDKVKEGDVLVRAFYPRSQLPFHLCSIQPIFILIVKLTKNEKLKDTLLKLIFPTATLGAFIAIIICTITVRWNNPQVYEYFFFHAFLVIFAISIVTKKQIEITWKSHLQTMGIMFLVFVASIWVNSVLSVTSVDPSDIVLKSSDIDTYIYTNFFYSMKPPLDNLPILNLDNGWFVYFFSIVLIGLTAISLLQLPFIVRSALKQKKQKQLN
jgi:uncharacterized membrane protein YwaF